jgi:hypothetical protein
MAEEWGQRNREAEVTNSGRVTRWVSVILPARFWHSFPCPHSFASIPGFRINEGYWWSVSLRACFSRLHASFAVHAETRAERRVPPSAGRRVRGVGGEACLLCRAYPVCSQSAFDNSPVIHRWVWGCDVDKVPAGTSGTAGTFLSSLRDLVWPPVRFPSDESLGYFHHHFPQRCQHTG